jgi:Na+/H+ antiporter NhaD/arsenite permease-like protein
MSIAQIFAVVIFIAMFVLVITEKIERQWATLACGAAMLVIVFGFCLSFDWQGMWDTINLQSIVSTHFWWQDPNGVAESTTGINWETILFIAGMMVMVEGMAKAGFFRWLCMTIAKLVKFKPVPIFITFMIMSAILAMFIDSITVILFLAAVTVELSRLLKFNPVPMILAEIFCANLGGSATMCGDPPNIIIGTQLGYSFFDFLTNTGMIAGISLVLIIFYFYFVFRKQLKAGVSPEEIPHEQLAVKIENKGLFAASCVIFGLAVVLLVTHAWTGLTVSSIGIFIAVLTVIISLIFNGKETAEILKKVDYKTLLFFIGLFIVVGGLEHTGILKLIADAIASISGGNVFLLVAIILWLSAIASAFVDNIPFSATMVPIIQELAAITAGIDLHTLAWTLAIGTDIGGNATPIGASANVVGMSVSAKSGHPIGWGKYCKYMVPATLIVLAIGTGLIFLRYLV